MILVQKMIVNFKNTIDNNQVHYLEADQQRRPILLPGTKKGVQLRLVKVKINCIDDRKVKMTVFRLNHKSQLVKELT